MSEDGGDRSLLNKDHQMILYLLENEELLTEWQWQFLSSLQNYPRLTRKQKKKLQEIVGAIEVKLAVASAKANRRARRRAAKSGVKNHAQREKPPVVSLWGKD